MKKYIKRLRHGDMILLKLDPSNFKKPNKSVEFEKIVVGLGEVTGHSHDVIAGENTKLKVFSYDNAIADMSLDEIATMENLIFEVLDGNAVISHDEHDELVLEEGIWLRCFQVEYNPFEKMVEKVRD